MSKVTLDRIMFYHAVAAEWTRAFGIAFTAEQVVRANILQITEYGESCGMTLELRGRRAQLRDDLAAVREFFAGSAIGATLERTPHWPRVMHFAFAMDHKFKVNLHKGDWRLSCTGDDRERIFEMLQNETDELWGVLGLGREKAGTPAQILDEAADVANFGLIIADLYGGGLGET